LLQAAVARQADAEVEEGGGQEAEGKTRIPRLLTVREVAVILRVCTATVYSMVERGELEHARVSNSIRVLVPRGMSPAARVRDQNDPGDSPCGVGT
jgi:excisionase family DNA binding protein